jgi:hypothetical protein
MLAASTRCEHSAVAAADRWRRSVASAAALRGWRSEYGEDRPQLARVRLTVVVAATLGTAAAVAVSGLIGFVGIIVLIGRIRSSLRSGVCGGVLVDSESRFGTRSGVAADQRRAECSQECLKSGANREQHGDDQSCR